MAKLHLVEKNGALPYTLDVRVASDRENVAVYVRAAALGFVGGLRSMTPFALLDWTKGHNPEPRNTFEQVLDSPLTRIVTSLLASGELVGDKLPQTPSRLSPGPLIARLGVGALAGLSIARRYRRSLLIGALLGAAGAGAGAAAGYYARSALVKATNIPDPVVGVLEDGLAFGLGTLIVKDSVERANP